MARKATINTMKTAAAPRVFNTDNPNLSALRIIDEPQFIKIIGIQFARDRGVILKTAAALRVHRNTLGRWVEQYPALKLELTRVRDAYAHKDE